jgi:hypothetical protein
MEPLILGLIILAIIAGLVAFDRLALHHGVDSRRPIGDDHTRRVAS